LITKRLAIVALLALLGLGTAGGCTTTGGGRENASAPTQTGTQLLSDAAAKTKGQSYTYTLAYGTLLTGRGVSSGDGKTGSVNMTVSDQASGVTIKVDALLVGADMYLKMDFGSLGAGIPGLGELGDKWMRVDAAKVPAGGIGLKPGADTVAPDSIVKGVASAERVSDTEITGTIDLAKSAPPGVAAADLEQLPAANRIVPFTATLDGQGRLAKVVIKMPAVAQFPASDLTTTFADYGTTVDIAKPPAADVVPAPDMIYQFLG
jgi:hypothetical protein